MIKIPRETGTSTMTARPDCFEVLGAKTVTLLLDYLVNGT